MRLTAWLGLAFGLAISAAAAAEDAPAPAKPAEKADAAPAARPSEQAEPATAEDDGEGFRAYLASVRYSEFAALCAKDAPKWKARFGTAMKDWSAAKADLIAKGRGQVQKMLDDDPDNAPAKSVAELEGQLRAEARENYGAFEAKQNVENCAKLGEMLRAEAKQPKPAGNRD